MTILFATLALLAFYVSAGLSAPQNKVVLRAQKAKLDSRSTYKHIFRQVNMGFLEDVDVGPLLSRLQRTLEDRWVPPPLAAPTRCVVLATIDFDGRVSNVRIQHSSGNLLQDASVLATFAGEAPLVSRPPEAFTVPVQLIFDNVRVRTDDDDHPYRVQYSNKELSIINSIFVDPGVKVNTCIGSESGKADTLSFYLTPSYPYYMDRFSERIYKVLPGNQLAAGLFKRRSVMKQRF